MNRALNAKVEQKEDKLELDTSFQMFIHDNDSYLS